MNSITGIDFSTGKVQWEIDGIAYEFPYSSADLHVPSTAVVSALDFSGLKVDMTCRNDVQRSLSISPPQGYDFDQCEDWAPKFAQELSKVCPTEIYPRYGHTSFAWGRVKLYTEWRDGGWGASFEYV